MSLTIRQRLSFAALHDSQPAKRHGHNYQLSLAVRGTAAARKGVLIDAAALSARLAELKPAVVGNNTAEALWAAAQQGWPAGVQVESLSLTEASGAGIRVENGQRLFASPGYFSAAHRTHAPRLSEAENLAMYGICDNPAGHGHNYRATVWHPTLAQAPPAVWAEFDHRNLSVDIPELHGRNVVTEAMAELIARRVPGAARVRLFETDTFYAEFIPATGAYYLGRRFSFSAAHELGDPARTAAENATRYGPCAAAGAHGHDYALEVVVGPTGLDALTETAFDLGEVDQAAAPLLAELHEADLDRDVPWLAGQVTTPETLATYVWERLETRLGEPLNAVGIAATPDREAWKRKG